MALLARYKDIYDLQVAHVNYHHRDSADRDEQIVRSYCEQYQLPFHKKDFFDDDIEGNFQDKARVFRYEFFAELCKKYCLSGVLVAHHLDDLLETYLLQKKRASFVSYYGLRYCAWLFGVRVYRPLLNEEKSALVKYCSDNAIAYGIDESNLSDDYQRNIIRHQTIEHLSYDDKLSLLKEIKEKNQELRKIKKAVNLFVKDKKEFKDSEFLNFPYREHLYSYLLKRSLSQGQVRDFDKKLKDSQARILLDDYYIVHEYGFIRIFKKPREYRFVYHGLDNSTHKYFKTAEKGSSLEAVTVGEDDFPLCVRSFKEGDQIVLRFGNKRLSRFFIDRKIAYEERLSWPVVLNKRGEIILVPGIGCCVSHYSAQANWFVIKLVS